MDNMLFMTSANGLSHFRIFSLKFVGSDITPKPFKFQFDGTPRSAIIIDDNLKNYEDGDFWVFSVSLSSETSALKMSLGLDANGLRYDHDTADLVFVDDAQKKYFNIKTVGLFSFVKMENSSQQWDQAIVKDSKSRMVTIYTAKTTIFAACFSKDREKISSTPNVEQTKLKPDVKIEDLRVGIADNALKFIMSDVMKSYNNVLFLAEWPLINNILARMKMASSKKDIIVPYWHGLYPWDEVRKNFLLALLSKRQYWYGFNPCHLKAALGDRMWNPKSKVPLEKYGAILDKSKQAPEKTSAEQSLAAVFTYLCVMPRCLQAPAAKKKEIENMTAQEYRDFEFPTFLPWLESIWLECRDAAANGNFNDVLEFFLLNSSIVFETRMSLLSSGKVFSQLLWSYADLSEPIISTHLTNLNKIWPFPKTWQN